MTLYIHAADERETHGALPDPGVHKRRRSQLAVVIAAHNEEAVIAATLESVIAAHNARDVFVFCDACTDRTADIARSMLPEENVIDHATNIGKSRGLEYMLDAFVVPLRYEFVSVIDADTTVEPGFFVRALTVVSRPGVVGVTGQVKSRWYRNIFSAYRTFIYAVWQAVFKRIQSGLGSVVIASGCSTVWRTSALRNVVWDHHMSTEDFSLTMQVHRRRLGAICYIASAVVWTQDPFSLRAYVRQSYRWTRAFWESIRKYRVGVCWISFRKPRLRVSMLDVSTVFLLAFILLYTGALLAGPLLIIWPAPIDLWLFSLDTSGEFAIWVVMQYLLIAALVLLVAVAERRPMMVLFIPPIIVLIYVDIVVSLVALASTIRSQYRRGQRTGTSAWVSPDRQAIPSSNARTK